MLPNSAQVTQHYVRQTAICQAVLSAGLLLVTVISLSSVQETRQCVPLICMNLIRQSVGSLLGLVILQNIVLARKQRAQLMCLSSLVLSAGQQQMCVMLLRFVMV